jgi:TRAP-type uncharacterized transport system fused permease subunit
VVFLSAAVMGFMGGALRPVERMIFLTGAALLFLPGVTASLAGLGLCAGMVALRLVRRRAAAAGAAGRGSPAGGAEGK